MVGNSLGRAHLGALEIVTRKWGIAMMAWLYSVTWHFSFLVENERSSNYVWLVEYGRNSRTRTMGIAYPIFVTKISLLDLKSLLCSFVKFVYFCLLVVASKIIELCASFCENKSTRRHKHCAALCNFYLDLDIHKFITIKGVNKISKTTQKATR